ncbi:hypothetical protein PTTW11_03125 [Pyrenophora teres f. teres]|uniref:Uncharacterized protein n=1 Tax=Pyrenophora teres f. teres TaxID=97479 RepID=A0A6S6VWB8_9PLEO|nr:hypothetical protein PTTW11_03125 [Pyrenophora teres f. teres]
MRLIAIGLFFLGIASQAAAAPTPDLDPRLSPREIPGKNLLQMCIEKTLDCTNKP